MNHTPGPWYEYDMGWSGQTAIAVKHANSNFLIVPAMNKGANARLIAAAPELLAACDELLEGMIPGEKHNTANVTLYAIGMIREAIRKATTL